MNKRPIRIPLARYTGKDERKQAEFSFRIKAAHQIESYINEFEFKYGDFEVFNYDLISRDLGIQKSIVMDLLMTIGGGSNGVTIEK